MGRETLDRKTEERKKENRQRERRSSFLPLHVSLRCSQMATDTNDVEDTAIWGPKMEKMFIDIMIDEVNKGSMENGQFSLDTWKKILIALNAKGKRNYTRSQLKQKFYRLRMKHRDFAQLLKQTGFGWNAETNTVHALEETWQTYLQGHPTAKQFRHKGCRHYKLLGIIFNKSTATGVLHHASTQDPPNTDDENELEDELFNSGVHVDVDLDSPTDPIMPCIDGGITTCSGKRTNASNAAFEREHKKESSSNQMGDALQVWAMAAQARAEAYMAKVEKYKRTQSVEVSSSMIVNDYSITRCMDALGAIEMVDNDKYMKAVHSFKDADWREMFINMPPERKKFWVDSL